MKNDIRQMIKTVIEEDAVNFKDHTSKVLYEKVGQKLEEQYQIVANNLFKANNETNNRTN
jgi:hypothetical protein